MSPSVRRVSERFSVDQPSAWSRLDSNSYDHVWRSFEEHFRFRPSGAPEGWLAIQEPSPSLTLDLSVIPDGAPRGAAYDAINAEALRCFVWHLADAQELLVLDWQHPAYRFQPATQALTWSAVWPVPVFPDGDYIAFLTPDFTEGTFGHPWEQTLCVMGERLVRTLGEWLATWLPIKREDGRPVEPSRDAPRLR